MKDIVFTVVLIAATIGLIYLIRLLSADFRRVCQRPRADFKVYFDENCECLEYYLDRVFSCLELRDFDLRVTVVDRVGTLESRQWLGALRAKLKRDFYIITEDDSDGSAKDSDDKRDG